MHLGYKQTNSNYKHFTEATATKVRSKPSLPECQPVLLANPVEVIGDLRINSRIT